MVPRGSSLPSGVGGHPRARPRRDASFRGALADPSESAPLDADAAREEIAGSKLELEDHLGRVVRAFSYPTGLLGEREARMAAHAGYELAVCCEPGVNDRSTDRFALRRRRVDARDSLLDFRAKLGGGHDSSPALRGLYRRLRYSPGWPKLPMVELHVSPAELGEVERGFGAGATCGAEPLPELAIVEETADGLGERGRVSGRRAARSRRRGRARRPLRRRMRRPAARRPSPRAPKPAGPRSGSRARRCRSRRGGPGRRSVHRRAVRAPRARGAGSRPPPPRDLGRPPRSEPRTLDRATRPGRNRVRKSFGAFKRPTAISLGTGRWWRVRGAAATSTALWITTLRSGLHVRASSPAASSFSETQIVTVVSGDISRSERGRGRDSPE